jgi:hypothetical protein
MPGGTCVGRGHQDTPILPGDIDPHDAAILPEGELTGVVTFGFARTVETASRRRAALLEGVALGLKTLERQVPLFACHGADTVDGSLFGVNDRIRALRVQWAGDRLSGVIVGWPLFFSPQFASIDQETNGNRSDPAANQTGH